MLPKGSMPSDKILIFLARLSRAETDPRTASTLLQKEITRRNIKLPVTLQDMALSALDISKVLESLGMITGFPGEHDGSTVSETDSELHFRRPHSISDSHESSISDSVERYIEEDLTAVEPASRSARTILDEIAALPKPPKSSLPTSLQLLPEDFLRKRIGGNGGTFSRSNKENKVVHWPEMITINPQYHEHAPTKGKNGALLFIDGRPNTGEVGRIYPTLLRVSSGLSTYLGHYKIVKRVLMPIDIWKTYSYKEQNEIVQDLYNSKWGKDLLSRRRIYPDEESTRRCYTQIADCFDRGKLRMCWVLLQFYSFNMDDHNTLINSPGTHPGIPEPSADENETSSKGEPDYLPITDDQHTESRSSLLVKLKLGRWDSLRPSAEIEDNVDHRKRHSDSAFVWERAKSVEPINDWLRRASAPAVRISSQSPTNEETRYPEIDETQDTENAKKPSEEVEGRGSSVVTRSGNVPTPNSVVSDGNKASTPSRSSLNMHRRWEAKRNAVALGLPVPKIGRYPKGQSPGNRSRPTTSHASQSHEEPPTNEETQQPEIDESQGNANVGDTAESNTYERYESFITSYSFPETQAEASVKPTCYPIDSTPSSSESDADASVERGYEHNNPPHSSPEAQADASVDQYVAAYTDLQNTHASPAPMKTPPLVTESSSVNKRPFVKEEQSLEEDIYGASPPRKMQKIVNEDEQEENTTPSTAFRQSVADVDVLN
jgi:hypothetical protein